MGLEKNVINEVMLKGAWRCITFVRAGIKNICGMRYCWTCIKLNHAYDFQFFQ